jgi:nucleotide-binding universal stress UspA family protein
MQTKGKNPAGVEPMRIIVAVSDVGGESSGVVDATASFPWPAGSRLRVITVAEKAHPAVAELIPSDRDVEDVQRATDSRAGIIATSAAAKLQGRGFHADSISFEGDPKKLILQHAKDWGADLIVVGSSDKSSIEKILLGSVSLAVLKQAPCSVLLVKPTAPR